MESKSERWAEELPKEVQKVGIKASEVLSLKEYDDKIVVVKVSGQKVTVLKKNGGELETPAAPAPEKKDDGKAEAEAKAKADADKKAKADADKKAKADADKKKADGGQGGA